MEQRRYGLFIRTAAGYTKALDAVKAALRAEGFGVLTEIDVKETMKQKLGAESGATTSSAPATRRWRTGR